MSPQLGAKSPNTSAFSANDVSMIDYVESTTPKKQRTISALYMNLTADSNNAFDTYFHWKRNQAKMWKNDSKMTLSQPLANNLMILFKTDASNKYAIDKMMAVYKNDIKLCKITLLKVGS